MSNDKIFGDGIDWSFEADRAVKEDGELFSIDTSSITRVQKYKSKGKVIDCGCNIGKFIEVFENAGYTYTGVDQSTHAIDIAKQYHPEGDFVNAFLWDMKFQYKFDIAFINAVLQHNNLEEKKRILLNIASLVKKNGIFVIAESTVLEETVTQLTHDGWIALVESFGFKLLETGHPNEFGLDDNYTFRKV